MRMLKDKWSSLIGLSVSDEEKSLITLTPEPERDRWRWAGRSRRRRRAADVDQVSILWNVFTSSLAEGQNLSWGGDPGKDQETNYFLGHRVDR
jgi:hypothetical protein